MTAAPPSADRAVYSQASYPVRFDWGLDGALAVGADVDAVVVVDILSFTTAVSVAIDAGALLYPYRWRDDSAAAFARAHAAQLAGARQEGGISLSPASLAGLAAGDRVVLPSPNGATICVGVSRPSLQVIAGSIRNASAVAEMITAQHWSVAVVAAGEHWRSSGGMRPCLEDLLGAGAILARLDRDRCSPEALTAVHAYLGVSDELGAVLGACVGGRELAAAGYSDDVSMAAMADASDAVPLLSAEGFFAAG